MMLTEMRKRPLENTQLLLDNGAQVDVRDEDGNTPLILAAKGASRPETIQLLIEKGAKVNARNNDGWTPLMIAARWCNNSEIILWLLDNGADATAENKLGKKAIYLARNYNKALKDTRALERLEQLAGE